VRYAAEFRRCLVDLDVAGARRLWAHVHPGWDQPTSDYEMLVLLHLARTRANSILPKLRSYSRRWLAERDGGGYAKAVGVATKNSNSPIEAVRSRSRNVRDAMQCSVSTSMKAGIDIDDEAFEVRRRMILARAKEIGGGKVGWKGD
jgi:hypothetical protein